MRTSNERFLIYHLSVIDGSSENFSVFHIFSSILERGFFLGVLRRGYGGVVIEVLIA